MSERRARIEKHRIHTTGETVWGVGSKPVAKRRRKRRAKRFWNPKVFGTIVSVAAVAIWFIPDGGKRADIPQAQMPPKIEIVEAPAPALNADMLEQSYLAADRVARAFLAETEPEKRLKWVRDPDVVRKRMLEYPEEARSEVGRIDDFLDQDGEGVGSLTSFSVTFPSEKSRLLDVVSTHEGAKVDWDAYARYGTAGWKELQSGEAKQAMVRVLCEPNPIPAKAFRSDGEWACYRILSPELPDWALGYVREGSLREVKMKEAIWKTPEMRQRFTLEIARHELEGETVFEITRCLAVGWVVMGDLEEEWESRVRSAGK